MPAGSDSEVVALDVGGRRFLTTRTTLCAQPGTLAAMFSGGLEPALVQGAAGEEAYFIDRQGCCPLQLANTRHRSRHVRTPPVPASLPGRQISSAPFVA